MTSHELACLLLQDGGFTMTTVVLYLYNHHSGNIRLLLTNCRGESLNGCCAANVNLDEPA